MFQFASALKNRQRQVPGRRWRWGTSRGIPQPPGYRVTSYGEVWLLRLALLLGVCTALLAVQVLAAMTFTTANVQQASLFQTVQLNLLSNPLVRDPSITTGDLVTFIPSSNTGQCVYNSAASASTAGYYVVTAVGTGGLSGQLVLAISSTIFAAGTSYYPCYLSLATQSATVVRRSTSSSSSSATDALLVWPALYQSFSTSPTSVSGGEGLVQLSIVQAAQTGRAINQGLTGSFTILLVPCGSLVINGSSTLDSDCDDINSLVTACATVGTASSTPTAVVSLSNLRGSSQGNVTGSFTVPYVPNTGGYYTCVPYCYSTAAGCGSAATVMSFTVVVSASSSNSTRTLTFGAADPGAYQRTPAQPQAREKGTLTFTGADLRGRDAVKVIRSSDDCTSSTAALLPNLELGSVQVTRSGGTATARVSFVAPELVTTQVVGQVCYRRSATSLWSPVYFSSSSPVPDFTIDVLQPTGFTIASASPNPSVGETITLTFQGNGLDGAVDKAYLSSSLESDPCTSEGGSSGSGSSSGSSAQNIFLCAMTGSGSSTAPNCTVVVDPTNSNQAMTLRVCYLKGGSNSQQTNYAELNGTLALQARNPTYTVTPYPLYAGQSASLVFTGVGLTADDKVQLATPGGTCGDGSATITTATLSAVTEINPGTSYQYTLVGAAEACIKVCYQQLGSTVWIVARSSAGAAAVSSSCDASDLYISAFPARYNITNLGSAAAGAQLSVGETGTMSFSATSGQTLAATMPIAVKIVQASDSCVTTPCGTALLAACAKPQSDSDYTSAIRSNGGVTYTASFLVNSPGVNYVVCVLLSGGSGVYVPVLPSSQSSPTSSAFGFVTASQNPILVSYTPSTWRVAMNTLTSTFSGSGLNASTNAVYAVAPSALLTVYTASDGTLVAVCPPVSQLPATVLVSSMVTSGSNSTISTTARYTRADQLYAGESVYLCYTWSAGTGDAHITMAGRINVSAAIPSSFAWLQPATPSGLRAAQALQLSFTSNVTSLSPSNDAVYFYRFVQTSNPNPNCYCDAQACATGTRITYTSNATLTASNTSTNTTIYTAPLGFDNYDFNATYIICYARGGQSADTYMGRVTAALANPTYYTVSSVTASVNRVGAPLTITATRRCLTTACALSLNDSMRLVPSSTQCSQLSNSGTPPEAASVQTIGSAVLGAGALTLSLTFVVDVEGAYRVCYQLAGDTAGYVNLPYSSTYVRSLLTLTTANPQSFSPVPSAPSSGQFVIMNIDCNSSDTLCSTCTTLRLVPGIRSSCWTNVSGTYSSDSCLTTTSVQFPNQYFAAGSYTVCYGSTLATSRRIPSNFTVAAANPVSYTPTAQSGFSIFTNQGTNYTLAITGTGLLQTDVVFLLPQKGYSCHDLRTGAVQSDGQLASWLAPSINPYPLQLTSTGATWVVSNKDKRFSAALLNDTDVCPGNEVPCSLKLCYLRSGTSWAPVTLVGAASSSSSSSSLGIQLVASNPSSVQFDRYPLVIGMYAMATVQGSGLVRSDALVIHANDCNGINLTVSVVGAAVVNNAGSEWQGVLRVTGTASRYSVCYWRAGSATEVVSISFAGQADASAILVLNSPLRYLLSPTNFSSTETALTQYEELIVGASFTSQTTAGVALSYVQLVSADASQVECNYAPFQAAAAAQGVIIAFPVVQTLASVATTSATALPLYRGRLNVAPGLYAMCMNTTNGLFRVTRPVSATAQSRPLTVLDAVPDTYAQVPNNVMPSQVVTLTFSRSATDSGSASDSEDLVGGDVVQIMDGSLYECGFPNATVVAAGVATPSSSSGSNSDGTPATTTVSLLLPTTIRQGSTSVPVAERNFTVCYQRQGSTFATVPRIGSAVDRNFFITNTTPARWTTSPQQAQRAAPLNITFYGNSSRASYLTVADVAFLVSLASGETPPLNVCITSGTTRTVITQGTMTKTDAVNTQWAIPIAVLPEGTYAVCYTAAANGLPVYVSSPATLTVYPTQSPSGAYLARSATALVNNLNVRQGERVYLLFNTTVALNVTLENSASPSESSATLANFDEVRIATDSTCATPLGAGVVDPIPSSFGYAPLSVVDPTVPGLTVPYLHLRIRANVGAYYVCMRRHDRQSGQAYYNFEVVGGVSVAPAVLNVSTAAVTGFTTTPVTPRAWVPHTVVLATPRSDVAMSDIVQYFFVAYTGSSSATAAGELQNDPCYRPVTASQAISAAVTLVNRTLQVYLSNPMFTQYSFGAPGTYLLCYEVLGYNIASVYPTVLTVANPSPIAYTVPGALAIQNAFTMSFTALDAIFASGSSNFAQIYNAVDATSVPNCSGAVVPSGGTTSFSSFAVVNPTSASVQPTLLTAAYYFVCFLTSGQTQSFPVPNAAGGFVFSAGLTGAQRYTVSPAPAYLGQQLSIVITGNQLSSNDHVKIVRVSQSELSGSSSATSSGGTYTSLCTSTSANADASEAAGAAGSTVQSTTGIVAQYSPRVNETGTFILCYQSALLQNAWVWVADVHQFNVESAHPTHYSLSVSPPYETEVLELYIHDSGNGGASTAGRLQSSDRLKLVSRGTGARGFDCTANASNSTSIGLVSYRSAQSNSSVNVYRICGSSVATVTVCYALAASASATTAGGTTTWSWAEVPLQSQPPTYNFSGVSIQQDPFVGPVSNSSSSSASANGVAPRPYEPFTFYFTSQVAGVEVRRVAFAQAPVTTCATTVSYVSPLLYTKDTDRLSEFTVSLPFAGNYALYLGPYTDAALSNITHSTQLVVGQCDPCNFRPLYGFVGSYALLSFQSNGGSTFGSADEARLFPVSQGLTGRPCEAPTGAFAGITFTPVAALSNNSQTIFNITTGTTAQANLYLGQYYVCYRKATTSATATFAVVAENNGTASTFSIYPADLLTATTCSSSPLYALETSVFNITARNRTLYPSVAFAASDELLIVPSTILSSQTGGGCAAITNADTFIAASGNRVYRASLDSYGSGVSNWYLTFPSQTSSVQYSWCFKLANDAVFRNVSSALQAVLVENPYEVLTTPPVILPDSAPVQLDIVGSGLQSTDGVYIVPEGQSCVETCSRSVTPAQWTGTTHTVQYINTTTTRITFAQPINTVISLGVCYRRTGRSLTRVTNLFVGQPNPISYTVNFVPRIGTRPTLTFSGANLTATDAIMIVQPGSACFLRNAVASGQFVSIDSAATTTAFFLPLIGSAVLAQSYTVCYEVSTVGAYVVVSPQLQVQQGGPSSILSSNTPMRGRATVLTVAQPQVGDELYIACVGCSCFDENMAVVPYGSVHATAVGTTSSLSSTSSSSSASATVTATLALRVGFNDTRSYPLCYRRSDSGYAQIGGLSYFLTPVTNSPSAVVARPASTAQYQGQRLFFNFSNYTATVSLGSGDLAMLVQDSRLCWDTPSMNADGIVVPSSVLTGVVGSPSLGEWAAHVPSLGPGVPSAATTSFPLSYVLCYRQGTQQEYVSVPYTAQPTVMQAADPSSFTTQPTTVEQGMVKANMTFAYVNTGQAGDTAYIVQFQTLTNTVCDNASSLIVAQRGSAYPMYTFNLSGTAAAGSSNTAVCYIRAGATVAEVPQLLTIAAGNPSGYVTNLTNGSVARERQYIEFSILGSGLTTSNDAVAFTDVPCANASQPINSSSHLARLGDATSNGTVYRVVTQFTAATSPISIYVCYRYSSMWREVGSPLVLNAPQPSSVQVITAGGAQQTPRAGQHLYMQLNTDAATAPIGAAVLSGATNGPGTWCHNFTDSDVTEPALQVMSAALLSVPVWEVAGASRLCIRNNASTLWADVAATVDAATIVVAQPNPLSMDVFPSPPRVGESVTLTFHLLVLSNVSDVVKITAPTYEACESAASIVGFPAVIGITVVNNSTTTVTLVDQTDQLRYRSFNATGGYRVCYYSATEMSWGVVGGSVAAGTVTVEDRLPQSWGIASGNATIGQEFALAFTSPLGSLQPVAGRDLAWAAPSTVSCGQDPYACPSCLLFGWNASFSNATVAVTTSNVSVRIDAMNVCYRLFNATAAQVPGALNITTGPIECVQQASFISGVQQQVTFRLMAGTDVTSDSWRLSFYATTALHCDARYLSDFVPGMAQLQSSSSTSATYTVLWPVGLGITTDKYTLCYTHGGTTGPVCTCGQIDAKTGECYIQGTPGSPQSFTPSPQPTYVGQTISLALTVNDSMTSYPPLAVKLVTYAGELTTCDGTAAFTPVGATLTRISATLYTYLFTHNYTLGSATLLVCALTDLSTSYVRVASTIRPSAPTSNNTLWIRPYLGLTTFPSSADFLRAKQTLNLTFTMASQRADDVVSLSDRLTIVSSPYDCIDSFIDSMVPSVVMQLFDISDTAFLTLPAAVLSANASSFLTRSLVTFSGTAASLGTHYFCYQLAAGTWAPVLPALTIQAALIDGCSITGVISAANGDSAVATDATTNNGGLLRAMFYAPTQIIGASPFATVASAQTDVVRVVSQNSWCTNDAAAVFTIPVAPASTSSASSTGGAANVTAIFFAPLSGAYKMCYRFGTRSNWSPACTQLNVTTVNPTGAATGCWNVGQTLSVTMAQAIAGHTFTSSDRLRFVGGSSPCRVSNRSLPTALATLSIGDVAQPTNGVALSNVTAGQATYALAPVLVRTGTSSVRLCYTDAAGNEFAVPMNYATNPQQSFLAVQPRQPAAVRRLQQYAQVGQRLFFNFTAATATAGGTAVTPTLLPYGTLPSPYAPGPTYNGSFDGLTLLPTSSSVAYTDGRCAVALNAGNVSLSAFHGVYGALAQSGGTVVPYTIGSYDPTVAQYYIVCYQLATCGAVDSGDPFLVNNANPSNVSTSVVPPRRGQLFSVFFQRDAVSSSSVALMPGSDRGVKQANLASCWTLNDNAGAVVQGTADMTYFTAFFRAQAPGLASNTSTRSCYLLTGGSWSEVPNGVADVLAANPISFDTVPASARVSQVNFVVFHGAGLGSTDRVKFIALSLNCSEDSVPPSSFAAFSAGAPTTGTAQGWTVSQVSSDGSAAMLNFTANATGTFSVCYRLAADSVWTLVYSDLTIAERNPAAVTQAPANALEGELFTLNFTALATGAPQLSADDRIVLYYGANVDCTSPSPDAEAPSITAAPSSTSALPDFIAFQVAAGTRGNYTLCYLLAAGTSAYVPDGSYIPVWGYDTVMVLPNPQNVTLFPARATSVYRPNELLTSVFEGWGLVATEDKSDAVKLIQVPASGGGATDAVCQQSSSAAAITYYTPFYANGTHAVVVWRVAPAGVNIPYAICYKLNGGQYHVIGNQLAITGAASPTGATSPKYSSASGGSLAVGESMGWTLTGFTASSCTSEEALLFFSRQRCNDVMYYENISALITSWDPEVIATTFPAGAAVVHNCSGVTRVRVPVFFSLPSDNTASSTAAAASLESVSLSLCYWSTGNDAVSVLVDNTLTLSEGVPPPLDVTLTAPAQEVFAVNLSVSPTTTDWVVLVADEADCVGISPPTNAALFTYMNYSATTGFTTVTAAVPSAGEYYVCYSYQSGACAASRGRECARVVAVMVATASNPSSWSGQPSPVYVSSNLSITFGFADSSKATAQGTTAVAWLSALAAPANSMASTTMTDVWMSCAASQATPSLQYGLTYNSSNSAWVTNNILTLSGPYALCYTSEGTGQTEALHIFAPVAAAGPIVRASNVTEIILPFFISVASTTTVTLAGGGLSRTDTVVAVAVPATVSGSVGGTSTAVITVPGDICTNSSYTPRVVSTDPDSLSVPSGGLTSMPRNFYFTSAGDYVLCYTPTYNGTTSGSYAPANMYPVLLSQTPFSVSPMVISLTIVSPAVEVGVELDLMFGGSGLAVTDTAALVYVGTTTGGSNTPTVASVCLSNVATYTPVTSVSADGTSANYSTTPLQQGMHMVCYRRSASSTPILIPKQLYVGVRSAVGAVFTVQPGGCEALLACTVQPTITLQNASHMATAAPYSTVSITLYLSDGTTAAPAGYLSGGTAYSTSNFSTFHFWALRVSTEGYYVMKATVTLPGGDTLNATSSAFEVVEDSSSVVSVATVACLPVGLLDRTAGSATAGTIDCLITALISDAPDGFTVVVNAGTVSSVTQNGTTVQGLPTYHFQVAAPSISATSAASLVNYIVITVSPIAPYEGWPVQNSPVTVRLSTPPSSLTTLNCYSGMTQLPLANMVRVGGSLSCSVQGITSLQGQPRNVVAPPEDLRVTDYYNSNPSASTVVSLGAYPEDVNGRYDFTLTPQTGLNITVAGMVLASSATSSTASVFVSMTNSPELFIVIGVPTVGASTLTCMSTRTSSREWYTPGEPLQCTVNLANAQGAVNGVQSDFSVLLPNGGSAAAINSSAWGTTLLWSLMAPPAVPSAQAVEEPMARQAAVQALAAAVTRNFEIDIRYLPTTSTIASDTGNMVYVTSVVAPPSTLASGASVMITLAGVGLETFHRYAIAAAPSCSQVLTEATPTEDSTAGEISLSFTVPSTAFQLCFAPTDARTSLQPLLATQWIPTSGAGSGDQWTSDDLVLLIVGVVLLFILLVLLAILLWCIFCGAGARTYAENDAVDEEKHRQYTSTVTTRTTRRPVDNGNQSHVYMPPRANTRYVARPTRNPAMPSTSLGSQTAPLPIEASPALSAQPSAVTPQQQQQPSTRIRINISDQEGAGEGPHRASPIQGRAEATRPPRHTSSTSSSGDRGASAPPGGPRGHHHRRSRRSSNTTTTSSSSIPPSRPPHPLQPPGKQSSHYADLDRAVPRLSDSSSFTGTGATVSRPRSVPPLPPPPGAARVSSSNPIASKLTTTAEPALSGLVKSPRQASATPTKDKGMLPPLPPPPPLSQSSLAIPSQPPLPGTVGVSDGDRRASQRRDDPQGEAEFVGPFRVAGHTSKPMVRSSSSSSRT